MRVKVKLSGLGVAMRRQVANDVTLEGLRDMVRAFAAKLYAGAGQESAAAAAFSSPFDILYKDEEGDMCVLVDEEDWVEARRVVGEESLMHLEVAPGRGAASVQLQLHEKEKEPAQQLMEGAGSVAGAGADAALPRGEMVRVALGLPAPSEDGHVQVMRRSRQLVTLCVDPCVLREEFGLQYCDRVMSVRGPATVLGVRDSVLWFWVDGDEGATNWGRKTKSYFASNSPILSRDTDSTIKELFHQKQQQQQTEKNSGKGLEGISAASSSSSAAPAPAPVPVPQLSSSPPPPAAATAAVEPFAPADGVPDLSEKEMSDLLESFVTMGFDRDLSLFILKDSKYNEEVALDRMLKMLDRC